MPTSEHIYKAGNLYFHRTEQFRLKGIVSKFLEKLIKQTIKNAVKHIELTECATFCYGELQMHSIIVPALAKLTDCFILEYPIRRGCKKYDKSGRVDYYCINDCNKQKEYHLFIELKCGQQGIPIRCNSFRRKNIELWKEANSQLNGIAKEIFLYKDCHYKNVMRVCIEVIPLYADISKAEKIDTKTLQDAFQTSIKAFQEHNIQPNFSALWEFRPQLREIANADLYANRQYWGLLFLCRIMPPIHSGEVL